MHFKRVQHQALNYGCLSRSYDLIFLFSFLLSRGRPCAGADLFSASENLIVDLKKTASRCALNGGV